MKHSTRIGFFGDGFTAGIGDSEGGGFASQLAHAADQPFINFGFDGATSTDVLKSWHDNADNHDLCGVVFSFGAEDCLFGDHKRPKVGQLDRLKNTKTLMVAARAKAPTLFISPFPVIGRKKAKPCIANTARQMTTIARANKVDYINVFDAVSDDPVWHDEALRSGGQYPHSAGYQVASRLIIKSEIWQLWCGKVNA